MSASIYAVEGAVFACLEASFLFLRASISPAPFEESVLVPAAVLGIANLILLSIAASPLDTQRLNFQVTFAFWLLFLYGIVECSISQQLANSLSLNPFSAAVSLAMLTVHMLIAAAPARESPWTGTAWADISLVLIPGFHACASHGTPQTMGLAVFVLLTVFLSLAVVILRMAYPYFPAAAGLGGYDVKQILEILKVCAQAVSVILALALAYLTGHTTWALPVVCLPLLAILSLQVWLQATHTENTDPSAPPASAVHDTQPSQAQPQVRPRQAPAQDMFPPRPAPYNPAAFPGVTGMSKFTQDALLFKNTRTLINPGKKNS